MNQYANMAHATLYTVVYSASNFVRHKDPVQAQRLADRHNGVVVPKKDQPTKLG